MKMIIILLISSSSFAETIFSCKEFRTTSMGYQLKDITTKKDEFFVDTVPANNPTEMVFIEKKKGALIKANSGQSELTLIGVNTYSLKTSNDDLIIFNVFKNLKNKKTHIFQYKALVSDLSQTLYTNTIMFMCD